MKKIQRRIVFALGAIVMIIPFTLEELHRQGILTDSSTSEDRMPINALIFSTGLFIALFCVFDKFYGKKTTAQ